MWLAGFCYCHIPDLPGTARDGSAWLGIEAEKKKMDDDNSLVAVAATEDGWMEDVGCLRAEAVNASLFDR